MLSTFLRKVLVIIFTLLILGDCANLNKKTGIVLEQGHEDFEGKQYISVKAKLEWMGFTNIKAQFIEDLVSYDEVDDETVEFVSIDGDSLFSKGDKFEANVPIEIVCHIIKKASLPIEEHQIRELPSGEIRETLIENGFINIEESTVYDLHPDLKDVGYVSQVLIHGKNIDSEQSYPFDSNIEIVTHRVLEEMSLGIDIDFVENFMFNLYNVKVKLDNNEEFLLKHGQDISISTITKGGDFSLYFVVENDRSINKTVTITGIKSNTHVKYTLRCEKDRLIVSDGVRESDAIVYYGK